MSAMNIAYQYQGQLYVNLTNRCTNRCKFCIRHTPSGVDGIDLWLSCEPDYEEVVAALEAADYKADDEIIFCGYGEPLMRADVCLAAARFIKETSCAKIRINTNGHGNIYNGRDITKDMEGLVDVLSISLNAPDAPVYEDLCQCDYGEDGFYAMLDFAKAAKAHVPEVVLSVVDVIKPEEIVACRKIAEDLGVGFRARVYSE